MKIWYEKPRIIPPFRVKALIMHEWIRRTAAEGYIYICPVCGNREKFVSRYCRNCGTRLSRQNDKKEAYNNEMA